MEILNQNSPEIIQIHKKLTQLESRLSRLALESVKQNWLTSKQVCDMLDISMKTLRHYREHHGLKYSRIGDKIYFMKMDYQDFLKEHIESFF